MRRAPLILLLSVVLSLCACGDRTAQRMLDRAENVLNENPGEAIAVLDSIGDDGLSRSQRMRHLLLLTNAQNKCDTVFRSDSIQRLLVDYYESHGTANERMLAHYLLGRALYDMGEVPAALESFQNAASSADTTSSNCDFHLLSRIHGQTARLFLEQEAPQNALAEINKTIWFARLSKDTLMELAMKAQIPLVYEMENMPDSVIAASEHVSDIYNKLGFKTEASRALGPSIEYLIQSSQLSKAKHHMDIFENHSGWFQDGNVLKSHEIYYYIKGVYYLKTGELDSAEYYLRKELSSVEGLHEKIPGFQGLCQLYKQKSTPDSMAKYAMNCQNLTNLYYDELAATNVQRLQAAYNYNRLRKIAEEKSAEAKNAHFKSAILLLVLAIVLLMLCIVVIYYRQKKKEFRESEKQLYDKLRKIEQGQKQRDSEAEAELRELRLLQNEVVFRLKENAKRANSNIPLKDWLSLQETIKEELPVFFSTICMTQGLRQEEINVCMLIRLQFKPKEICNITGLSPQVITNMRKRLLNKIFGKAEGGSKDFDDRISKIR